MLTRKHGILRWIVLAVVVVGLGYFALKPEVVDVDVAFVERGDIEQTLFFDGKVRYVSTEVVSNPVTSVYRPANVDVGDTIIVGQILGTSYSVDIDQRLVLELTEREGAMRHAIAAARTQRKALQTQIQQLQIDQERMNRLYQSGAVSLAHLEQARLRYDQISREEEALRSRIEQLEHERSAIRQSIEPRRHQGMQIRSKHRGVVLRKFIEEERLLPAGTVLYEIGSKDSTEVVIDVLSTDAAMMRMGMEAMLDVGQQGLVPAVVSLVEPSAQTKLSALGIEEQRVQVHLKPFEKLHLGDGYTVGTRVIVWRVRHRPRVSVYALTISNSDTAVFEVRDSKVYQHSVKLGRRARDYVEVLQGIQQGTMVVLHPHSSLRSGARIRIVAD